MHPYACDCDQQVLPGVPWSMIEFPHSTTRAVVNMLSQGTFARFPEIPFIFSHAGGTIPFLVHRIEGQASVLKTPGWRQTLQCLHYHTAGSANRGAFAPLLQLVGAQQILLGTGFPCAGEAGAGGGAVAGLEGVGLSDGDPMAVQVATPAASFAGCSDK